VPSRFADAGFQVDLPIASTERPAKIIRVNFDNWMWLQSEDRLLKIACVKRAGVDIGEVAIPFGPQ